MGIFDFFKVKQFKKEIEQLKQMNDEASKQLQSLGAYDYFQIKEMTESLHAEYEKQKVNEEKYLQNQLSNLKQDISDQTNKLKEITEQISVLHHEKDRLTKNNKTQRNKLSRSRELVNAVNYALENYFNYEPAQAAIKISDNDLTALDEISPSIILKLHCMDVKDLRKAYRQNDKQISSVLEKYSSRYTTKANQAIYKLMVIALRAELQNILYNLKYEKLNKAIDDVKCITQKYLQIAGEGNQNIAGTLTKFIGEIEYLFINAVKIEYNYYVKKEQARQEQLAIREQMRQEAEERKALEIEKKKVEKEESKYLAEIEKAKIQIASATAQELIDLKKKLESLETQLADVVLKKEEITNLANGKAGNVYIISNLGSFGKNVFKIGMTRRINPQERVNELGDASVPFKFDVHSFIFSEDAVGLEGKLHQVMDDKRVNKVNRRKEFFYTSIDELEKIVSDIDPTAEFNRTMLAEEFRQSLSTDEIYSSDYIPDFEDDNND